MNTLVSNSSIFANDVSDEAVATTFIGGSSSASSVAVSPESSIPSANRMLLIPELRTPLYVASSPLNQAQAQNLFSTNLSSSAITVGFEDHAVGTRYTQAVQRQDWTNIRFSANGMNELSQISNRFARSGSQSLRITYPASESSTLPSLK